MRFSFLFRSRSRSLSLSHVCIYLRTVHFRDSLEIFGDKLKNCCFSFIFFIIIIYLFVHTFATFEQERERKREREWRSQGKRESMKIWKIDRISEQCAVIMTLYDISNNFCVAYVHSGCCFLFYFRIGIIRRLTQWKKKFNRKSSKTTMQKMSRENEQNNNVDDNSSNSNKTKWTGVKGMRKVSYLEHQGLDDRKASYIAEAMWLEHIESKKKSPRIFCSLFRLWIDAKYAIKHH